MHFPRKTRIQAKQNDLIELEIQDFTKMCENH